MFFWFLPSFLVGELTSYSVVCVYLHIVVSNTCDWPYVPKWRLSDYENISTLICM